MAALLQRARSDRLFSPDAAAGPPDVAAGLAPCALLVMVPGGAHGRRVLQLQCAAEWCMSERGPGAARAQVAHG